MSNNYYDLYLWNPVIPECINTMTHVFRLMCIVLVYLSKNLPTNVAFLLICFMSFCLYQMTLNGLLELIYEKRKKRNQQEEEVKTIQLAAVKENGNAIQYTLNPDKDVQLAAVKENGNAIQYILNPDKDVQLAAVQKNDNNYNYYHFPVPDNISFIDYSNIKVD